MRKLAGFFLCATLSTHAAPHRSPPPRGVLGTYVRGPERLSAGAPAALRIATHASTSETTAQPFPDVEIEVTLSAKGHQQRLFHGRTDRAGVAEARFTAPDWPDGDYQLQVEARADDGRHDHQAHQVAMQAGARLFLESDKPLYQPSQVIHLKAVAQRPIDGRPVAAREATFLVFDPRGNEVFRQTAKLSEFGVAAADFQLADEITMGSYRARVETEGSAAGERSVSVERYVLPKFKLAVETDKTWYAPGNRVHISVEGRYFFGKPVAGGKLTINAGSQTLHAKLDPDGKAKLELEVPKNSVDESTLTLAAEVVDAAEHREQAARALTIASDPIRLALTTASSSAVVGVENRAWLSAARPDGTPIAGADVDLRAEGMSLGTARTDALGVAELRYTPRRGGGCVMIEAGLHQPGAVTWEKKCQPMGGTLVLTTDRALYPTGQPIQVTVEGLGADGTAYLDVEKDGQLVDTVELAMKGGRGAVTLAPDARRFGTLGLVAYRVGADGKKQRDAHLVYVERPSALKLELSAAQPTFRPGENGRLHVRVLDGEKGVRASVGLVMVDQSLLALRAMQPGSARLFFMLAEEASRPSLAMKMRPGGYTLERLVEEPQLDDLKQEAARILLSGAVPPSRAWETDPWAQRLELRDARLQKLADALPKWAQAHLAGEPHGKSWRWRRYLVEQMGGPRDPWGRPYSTDEVIGRSGIGEFEWWAGEETNRRLQLIYLAVSRLTLPADPTLKRGVMLTMADLEKLVADGKLDKSLLTDPWGRPFRIHERKKPSEIAAIRSRFIVASNGPDGSLGDADDLYAVDYFGPRSSRRVLHLADMMNIQGAVAGEAFGRGGLGLRGVGMGGGGFGEGTVGLGNFGTIGHGSGKSGGEEARVRRDFPETMLWLPEIITDARGEADIDARMADSITTWQLQAEAISADGRIATGKLEVRAFQDFFVDLDLPPALTQHDEVAVPVAIYNYLPRAQRVTLTLDDAAWFARTGEQVQSIDLAPQQVGVRYFRIRIKGIGNQKLLVRAQGTAAADAIEKPVHITPDGSERALAFQDRLEPRSGRTVEGRVSHDLVIPQDAIADASLAQLKIYPSMATHVIEGLDSMLRMPGGCFEQTSSTNYPNALILDYLRRTKKATPEVEKKATAFLQQGYQRLLSFEVPGGGFSWFGSAPANKILTAYGVEEFHDMARVFHVDKRVIERTQSWLARQQKSDGSWAPDTQFINEGATNHFNSDVVRITAYIAVALQHTGWRGPEIARAIDFVRRAPRPKDPYTLALVTELESGSNEAVLEELWSQRRDLDKTSSFTSKEKTPTYGDGKSGTVETTALAAYAMLQAPAPKMARVDRAISYLLANKDSFGNWYSTQATILSLKALLGYGEKAGQRARGTAIALVDGREVARVRVSPDIEALQTVELPAAALPGAHKVELRFDGDGPVAYQLVGRWWEPKHEAQPSAELEVATRLDKETVKPGEVVVEEVKVWPHGNSLDMPIVTAGLPPGFDVDGEELQKLVKSGVVDKVQQGPRELTFYLTKIDRPLSLKLHLTSRFPEKVQLPAATAYEYYRPERRASGAPVMVTVGG